MPTMRIQPRLRSAIDGASKKRSKPRRQREGGFVERDPTRKGGPKPGPMSGDFRQTERPEASVGEVSNIRKKIEEREEGWEEDKAKNGLSTGPTLKLETTGKGHVHAAMHKNTQKDEEDRAKDRLSTASTIVESQSLINLPSTPEAKKDIPKAGTRYSTRRPNPKVNPYVPTNRIGSSSSQKKSYWRKSSVPLIRQTITEEDDQMVLYPSCSKVDSILVFEPSEREALIRRAWKRARENETRFQRAARKLSRGRIDSEIGMCLKECGMEDVLWKYFGAEDGQKNEKKVKISDKKMDGKGKGTQQRKCRSKKSVNVTSSKKRVVMGGKTVDAS
jgi:hypothetical protein